MRNEIEIRLLPFLVALLCATACFFLLNAGEAHAGKSHAESSQGSTSLSQDAAESVSAPQETQESVSAPRETQGSASSPQEAASSQGSTSIAYEAEIPPIVLVSYTGNGEPISVVRGEKQELEAVFSGGFGDLSYSWKASYNTQDADSTGNWEALEGTGASHTLASVDREILVICEAGDMTGQSARASYLVSPAKEAGPTTEPEPLPNQGSGPKTLPKTGDSLLLPVILLACACVSGLLLLAAELRRKRSKMRSFEVRRLEARKGERN